MELQSGQDMREWVMLANLIFLGQHSSPSRLPESTGRKLEVLKLPLRKI